MPNKTYGCYKALRYSILLLDTMKLFTAIGMVIIFLFGSTNSYAQVDEKSFISKIEQAPGDSARILALGNLANYYLENYEVPRGDSVLRRQLQIAEASRNQNLMLWVLFKNPLNRFNKVNNNPQHKLRLQYALDYARNNELNDYVSLAYCRFSAYELAEGNIDKGLSIANLAITTSFASSNDSVKALCALQLGYAYLMQGNALMAFRAFNNAYDLAVKKYNKLLVAEVYRAIAAMYKTLGQAGIAIDYIFRSMEVFEKAGLRNEVAADYIALGKLYSYGVAREYLLRAEKLADSVNSNSLKLEAQKILFSYMMTKEKPSVVLQFLQQHKELVKLYEQTGPYYTNWMYGEVYLYGRMPDSARYYFEKAAPFFDSVSSINQQKDFYDELANSYYESKAADIDKAIFYKEKSLQLSKQVSGLREIKTISYHLSDLYERKGDLVRALYYNRQYDLYKDSLELLSKDKDLALLEIGNETKRKQEAAQYLQEKKDRLHNLQYMVITISVLTAFVLLLFLGLFKLSKLTIQVLGFLSFISFFEFIIMLLDTYIHHITHGEPLKVWLIKIGLLSMLLPLHHYLEEKVIHYLLSKKLIEAKSFFYLRKVFTRHKKNPSVAAPAGENIPVPEKDIFVP